MDLGLKDKVVVVTGASKGIGLATARLLLQEGAKVAICSVTESHLREAEQELSRLGAVYAEVVDMTQEQSVYAFADHVVEKLGPIDSWVNNVGAQLTKSTLFNVITGMYNPTEGKVEMLGQDVTGWKPYRITELGFSRTFQNIRLFPRMTVQDNVIVGMHTRTKGNIFSGVFFTKKEKEERASCVREADTILRLLGLYEDRFEMGTSLPYGSQRKLEIARALATRPKLLLLDEPAAGMNEQETEELRQIVYRLKEMGYTILLIEHDMKFVMNICERIYVLNNGCMISSGTPDEVRTDPVVIEAYLGKEE